LEIFTIFIGVDYVIYVDGSCDFNINLNCQIVFVAVCLDKYHVQNPCLDSLTKSYSLNNHLCIF